MGSCALARWTAICSGSPSRESHARNEGRMFVERVKLLAQRLVRCRWEWGELPSSHRRLEHRPERLLPVRGQIQRSRGFLIEPLDECSLGLPLISPRRFFEANFTHRSRGILKARTLSPFPPGSEEVKAHSRRACNPDNRSDCKNRLALIRARYSCLQSTTWFLLQARGAGESPH